MPRQNERGGYWSLLMGTIPRLATYNEENVLTCDRLIYNDGYPADDWSLSPIVSARYSVALEILSVRQISAIECCLSL